MTATRVTSCRTASVRELTARHHVICYEISHRPLSSVAAIHCDGDLISDINNTFVSVNANMTHYDINVTISCATGYQYPESTNVVKVFNKTVRCEETGEWTEIPEQCEGLFTKHGRDFEKQTASHVTASFRDTSALHFRLPDFQLIV